MENVAETPVSHYTTLQLREECGMIGEIFYLFPKQTNDPFTVSPSFSGTKCLVY